MKTLIAEDGHVCSIVQKRIMSNFGDVEHVVDGVKAADSFRMAHKSNAPFDLILMDIIMPESDGLDAVSDIR